jgi:hypothetical protein
MTTVASDPLDRLYDLVPVVYRLRDAEQGWRLRALLQVIAEQVEVIEDDIEGLYRNWFVETCDDWVLPYIGALVGFRPAGGPNAPISRSDVANTVRLRRRKGTLAALGAAAGEVGGWPLLAVEFYRSLVVTQNLNHLHLDRGRTAELRNADALSEIGTAFDRTARNVDIRRLNSSRTVGRGGIPDVGVYLWRLQSRTVTRAPALCYEEQSPNCYLFSALGNDTPLFVNPEAPIADPALPTPISRFAFERREVDLDRGEIGSGIPFYYGETASLMIWTGSPPTPVDSSRIVAANLKDWSYRPEPGHVAVDPHLGRIMFPPNEVRRQAVTVSYVTGAVAPIGGGEYPRPLSAGPGATLYRVGPGADYPRLNDAVSAWATATPAEAVIEIQDSGVYAEPFAVELKAGQTLQLRAAEGTRPVLRLLDWQADRPDELTVSGERGSWFVLDGITVTGRGMQIDGEVSGVLIRHSTLVPGWGLTCHCEPRRPTDPSIEVLGDPLCLTIEHSIVGALQIERDQTADDPLVVRVSDSIIDATGPDSIAIGASGKLCADSRLTIVRSTVVGAIQSHIIDLAENSIFAGAVLACRRQVGCVRFCALPADARTPAQYECTNAQPVFDAVRYGAPAYLRLSLTCPREISAGAEDGSEMGVYHDLMQPLRLAAVRQRLAEFSPASSFAGVIFAT